MHQCIHPDTFKSTDPLNQQSETFTEVAREKNYNTTGT